MKRSVALGWPTVCGVTSALCFSVSQSRLSWPCTWTVRSRSPLTLQGLESTHLAREALTLKRTLALALTLAPTFTLAVALTPAPTFTLAVALTLAPTCTLALALKRCKAAPHAHAHAHAHAHGPGMLSESLTLQGGSRLQHLGSLSTEAPLLIGRRNAEEPVSSRGSQRACACACAPHGTRTQRSL